MCLLMLSVLSCRPPSSLTPCHTDKDCPLAYRCDLTRSFCYPGPTHPAENTDHCQKIHIFGVYFSGYDGYFIYLHFYDSAQERWNDNFTTTVQDGQVNIQRHYERDLHDEDRVEILLDVNGDERCGPHDGIWAVSLKDFDQSQCPYLLNINLSEGLQSTSCESFKLLADINGDGCVDRLDINLMMSEFALSGTELQSDLDQNGRVDQTDLNQLLTQYCEGDESCCAGEDAGVPAIDTRILQGDSNCDGQINGGRDEDPETFSDLEALELYLQDSAAYELRFPTCPAGNSDVNCDGQINNDDVSRMQDCAPTQDCSC